MAHRIYRLSLSPEYEPQVRRVVDFDGRSTLDDVHSLISKELLIDDGADHLYAFFLSGRYWDAQTEYVDPRTEGRRADKVPLFRLGLRVGQRFVYVFDYGSEQRHSITVVAITDLAAPLEQPVLVESVGEVSASESDDGELQGGEAPSAAIAGLIPLAEAIFSYSDQLDSFETDEDEDEDEFRLPEAARPTLRQQGDAALELARVVHEDLQLLAALDRWFGDDGLIALVLSLPVTLASAGEVEQGLRVAEAFAFCARDELNGDSALILARAGRREEALARVTANLETARVPYVAEGKAGDVYRALGEDDAAEAYYRRSLAVAETESERREAALRITSLLLDTGREAEATVFVREQGARAGLPEHSPSPAVSPKAPIAPKVGRNDPCTCGSGKKYKKCHGVNA